MVRIAKCLPGQPWTVNSDLIFLRAIITRDENPIFWSIAERERAERKGSWQAVPARFKPRPRLPGNGTRVRRSSEDSSPVHSMDETDEQRGPNLASKARFGGFYPRCQIKTGKREVRAWLTDVVSGGWSECAKAML